MNPLVSIVIPTYNNENDIQRCVMSCLRQSYSDVEVIVVDDGSTDGTAEILDQLESLHRNHPTLRVIHQENQGVSAARDNGAAAVSGEYLTFVDADDYIGPDYICRFVEDAEAHHSDLCICGYTEVQRDVKKRKSNRSADFRQGNLSNEMEGDCYGSHSETHLGNEGMEPKRLKPWQYEVCVDESYAYHLMATWARLYRTSFWREHGICFGTERNTRGEDIPVGLVTNYFARNITITDQTEYYYVQNETSARHNMRGLKQYSLPYREISDCVDRAFRDYQARLSACGESGGADRKRVQSHWYFFEFGLLRTFSLIQFDLLRGADRDTRRQVYSWENNLIRKYLQDVADNPYVKLRNAIQVPLYQKVAVWLYRLVYRCVIDKAV